MQDVKKNNYKFLVIRRSAPYYLQPEAYHQSGRIYGEFQVEDTVKATAAPIGVI